MLIGAPIGGGCAVPGGTTVVVTITVASVGPYVFTSRRPADHAPATAPGNGSAPASTVPSPGTAPGSSTPSNDGTTLAATTPRPVISPVSAPGSDRCAAVAITSVPPAARVTATSSTDASKLNDANCSTRTPGPAPSTGPRAAARFTTPPCPTSTPFGVPVDPEV